MKKLLLVLILLIWDQYAFACANQSQSENPRHQESFQSSPVVVALFENLITEIYRLDGDGLISRINRQKSWQSIVDELKQELQNSSTDNYAIGRVFSKLDAAYPNLHAHIRLHPHYDYNEQIASNVPVRFAPEIVNNNETLFK